MTIPLRNKKNCTNKMPTSSCAMSTMSNGCGSSSASESCACPCPSPSCCCRARQHLLLDVHGVSAQGNTHRATLYPLYSEGGYQQSIFKIKYSQHIVGHFIFIYLRQYGHKLRVQQLLDCLEHPSNTSKI